MTVAGADATATTPRSRFNDPNHASDVAVSKRDLTSWWKQFKRGNVKRDGEKGDYLGLSPIQFLSSRSWMSGVSVSEGLPFIKIR